MSRLTKEQIKDLRRCNKIITMFGKEYVIGFELTNPPKEVLIRVGNG